MANQKQLKILKKGVVVWNKWRENNPDIEIDLRKANLSGRTLSGINLNKADLTNAIIRSTNFTNANLTGTNFTLAKCGIVWYYKIFLILTGILTSLLFGLSSVATTVIGSTLLDKENFINIFNRARKLDDYTPIYTLIHLFIIVSSVYFSYTVIRKGISNSRFLFQRSIILVVILFLFQIFLLFLLAFIEDVLFPNKSFFVTDLIFDTALILLLLVLAIIVALLPAAYLVVVIQSIILALSSSIMSKKIAIVFTFPGLISIIFLIFNENFIGTGNFISGYISVLILSISCLSIAVAGIINGLYSLANNNRDVWLKSLAIDSATFNGTRFCNADLTEASFYKANLKSADFRNTNLTHVYWYKSESLELVHPGLSYLKNTQLRKLLVDNDGQNQNFDRQDLRGVNLQGVNLTNASFVDTDLSQANLKEAILFEAKLVQTNLDKANLSNANLTAAYIEDWGITRNTLFDGVKGDYVYQKLPTKYNRDPNRMPPSEQGNFRENDLFIFITSVLDTLDLYHRQNINATVALTVLKGLTEDYPIKFELAGVEKCESLVRNEYLYSGINRVARVKR